MRPRRSSREGGPGPFIAPSSPNPPGQLGASWSLRPAISRGCFVGRAEAPRHSAHRGRGHHRLRATRNSGSRRSSMISRRTLVLPRQGRDQRLFSRCFGSRSRSVFGSVRAGVPGGRAAGCTVSPIQGHPVGAKISVNLAILRGRGPRRQFSEHGRLPEEGAERSRRRPLLRRGGPRRRLDDRGRALRRQSSTNSTRPRRRRAPDRRQQGLRAWPPRPPSPLYRGARVLSAPLCITRDECDRSLDLFKLTRSRQRRPSSRRWECSHRLSYDRGYSRFYCVSNIKFYKLVNVSLISVNLGDWSEFQGYRSKIILQ